MRSLGALLSLGLCLAAEPVLAEPDAFALGNGQHGALRVQQMDVSINDATALAAPATVGGKRLSVADETAFAAGELVLVLQVHAEGPAPAAGTPGPVDLDRSGAGQWEFARLESVASGALNLTAPLTSSYSAPGSQVVRVPEYTQVHVLPSASLVAQPWNGSSGGVLAFLATDAVLNQGVISADGAGFRGGTFATSPTRSVGCTELNQPRAEGGARKGEGLFTAAPGAPTHGYGALANGAGGGNCDDGGGGGGGHGGAGGQGGYTSATDGARDVGGRGGLALRYAPLRRLMFGGGGGAGAGNGNGGAGNGGTSGGAGGGILYIRARDFQGSQGVIRANGQAASDSTNDGAGGGGAGGHITLRVEDRLTCAALEAHGGAGGSNPAAEPHGPGGGGAGGVVLLQGEVITCASSVVPGLGGSAAGAPDGASYGATPGPEAQTENQGMSTVLAEPFASPAAPSWVTPSEGEETGPRPQLQGTALPGSTVQVFLNGQPLETVVASESGTFTLQPTQELPLGPQQVRASAERLGLHSALTAPRAFTVGTPSPTALQVGCGCGASPAAGSGVFVLGVLLFGMSRRQAGRLAAERAALAGEGPPSVHLPLQAPAGLSGRRGAAHRAGRGR
ncbi:adventurous gliding motility protein AgmC [Hyalangium sp.]|uniref:adventurous gliding motility protein AgmC n=1 Tax=Hyalangium sp. TaxID=2028555 RepID=UPI002D2A262B|nr:hemagglutinin [Hyalangium sp.]HYH95412.1 hemagglutinin [Hyalangium sp.]